MGRKSPINPFYPLLVVVSVVFVITACAYGVMTVHGLSAAGEVSRHPLLALLDRHGMLLLFSEVGMLAAMSFLAMGTDRYWSERRANRDE